MNYHVFIVDETTFKYHLEYSFAGTGSRSDLSPFLSKYDYKNSKEKAVGTTSSTEIKLVGMISDISRVRIDDKIIFYLQAKGDRQGMFFGVFRATSTAFFDENNSDNYLKDKLNKGLSFRIMIEKDEVFPFGITEHEYLDSLEGKNHPYEMCWSLIYRKLKGSRGCTMITDYEFKDLLQKLKLKNSNHSLKSDGFTYNSIKYQIIESKRENYIGGKKPINITSRMLFKAMNRKVFEVHLQAHIMQNFDKKPLMNLLIPFEEQSFWIGNEVSCGVGMQRIDIMIIQEVDDNVYIKIIELKHTEPYDDIIKRQIIWYIKWVSEYVAPNYINKGKRVHILPCVLAKQTKNKPFIDAMKEFNGNLTVQDNLEIREMEYISFDINDKEIFFNKEVY
ncbi:MAG: DUF91 domain-containing protein [Clostridia bacterium]